MLVFSSRIVKRLLYFLSLQRQSDVYSDFILEILNIMIFFMEKETILLIVRLKYFFAKRKNHTYPFMAFVILKYNSSL
jgi:hypothetical protein